MSVDAPFLMALAALVTAVVGIWRLRAEQRAAAAQAATEAERAADEGTVASGRLSLEERQWVMQVAHADNQRLRAENDALREQVTEVGRRLDAMEERWRETETTNRELRTHVERCERRLAELGETP